MPKKGSLSDCNNLRGITLLSVPSKISCKVIIQRVSPKLLMTFCETNKLDVRIKFLTLKNILDQMY